MSTTAEIIVDQGAHKHTISVLLENKFGALNRVAGMFSATREVARMVGEKQFSILLQQGEKRHIHISLVTDSTMMVIVFEDYKKIGKVRFEARRAGELLFDKFRSDSSETRDDISVPQFKEYALNLIDQIFTTSK